MTTTLPDGLTWRNNGHEQFKCDDCGAWAWADEQVRHSSRCDTPALQPALSDDDGIVVARPKRLRSGAWGAVLEGEVLAGDDIVVRAKSGKTWSAVVRRVVWTDGRTTIVETRRPARQEHNSVAREVARFEAGRGDGNFDLI